MSSSFDNVIVGGGPAGSMLALRLAAAGREVILLEKQRGPHHKVCGEFLSAEALGYLKRIGIDARALGAEPIQYIRLHTGRKSVHAALPFRQRHRKVFKSPDISTIISNTVRRLRGAGQTHQKPCSKQSELLAPATSARPLPTTL